MGSKAPYRVVDLLLTGNFQKEMILETDDRDYQILSTDDKTDDLVSKYGENIFGIAPENKTEAQALNTKKLAELLKKAIA